MSLQSCREAVQGKVKGGGQSADARGNSEIGQDWVTGRFGNITSFLFAPGVRVEVYSMQLGSWCQLLFHSSL